jgi:uncharacterized protein
MKAMLIPGNGGPSMQSCWYPKAREVLKELGCKVVIVKEMPDPVLARSQYWLPFIAQQVGDDPSCVLVGHSSGAIAILRYLEKKKAQLAVLVAAYHTDLDLEGEKLSGYFDLPWNWEAIKANAKRIIIFASPSDSFIPISEPRYIARKLKAEYHELPDRGHFQDRSFPELESALQKSILGR